MIIIVDVNIILSALIKDSTTREIIIKSGQDFYFPEPSIHTIRKHRDLILEKSGLSQIELLTMLNTLFRFIQIVPTEEILQNWDEAKKIMEHIDPEDVTFIAAALGKEDAVIWSDDKHFDRQNRVVNLKTSDIVRLFYREY